ncbi:MAG TPA: response regulator [Gemmatimonadales bacterium]|jgi:CheY-like chemotaxis protein|nr:response regulator [Gemmatimonadales bacterium]
MADASPHPATILVVDDEPQVRRLASRALEREGYRVIEATDGLEALGLFTQDARIDLLVTDVRMPHTDGIVLAAALRRRFPAIPVLFMSGYPRGSEPAPEPFLAKPFEMRALCDRVRELLDTREGAGAPDVLN